MQTRLYRDETRWRLSASTEYAIRPTLPLSLFRSLSSAERKPIATQSSHLLKMILIKCKLLSQLMFFFHRGNVNECPLKRDACRHFADKQISTRIVIKLKSKINCDNFNIYVFWKKKIYFSLLQKLIYFLNIVEFIYRDKIQLITRSLTVVRQIKRRAIF